MSKYSSFGYGVLSIILYTIWAVEWNTSEYVFLSACFAFVVSQNYWLEFRLDSLSKGE